MRSTGSSSKPAGTPSPVAPTDRLVVGGWYRYVRNPMYVAVVTAIVGQALWFGQPVLLGYAALVWAVVAAFARWCPAACGYGTSTAATPAAASSATVEAPARQMMRSASE